MLCFFLIMEYKVFNKEKNMNKALKLISLIERSHTTKTHHDLEFDCWGTKATGLPCFIFTASSDDISIPQIKASNKPNPDINSETITFTIDDNPKIISNYTKLSPNLIYIIKQWILVNKELLMDYWNWNVTGDEFYKNIKQA